MTDISIIGTGCLIVALVIAAVIVVRLRQTVAFLREDLAFEKGLYRDLRLITRAYEAAAAKAQAQRIAAAKKGREAQAAAKLAKVAK